MKRNKKQVDWKTIDWPQLYMGVVEENKILRKQIEVLESILKKQLPIVEANIIDKKNG
tara:strand:- start:780 stop:953 length:174 start_codon:yes stop_codon:yes gene_type:complete